MHDKTVLHEDDPCAHAHMCTHTAAAGRGRPRYWLAGGRGTGEEGRGRGAGRRAEAHEKGQGRRQEAEIVMRIRDASL